METINTAVHLCNWAKAYYCEELNGWWNFGKDQNNYGRHAVNRRFHMHSLEGRNYYYITGYLMVSKEHSA